MVWGAAPRGAVRCAGTAVGSDAGTAVGSDAGTTVGGGQPGSGNSVRNRTAAWRSPAIDRSSVVSGWSCQRIC